MSTQFTPSDSASQFKTWMRNVESRLENLESRTYTQPGGSLTLKTSKNETVVEVSPTEGWIYPKPQVTFTSAKPLTTTSATFEDLWKVCAIATAKILVVKCSITAGATTKGRVRLKFGNFVTGEIGADSETKSALFVWDLRELIELNLISPLVVQGIREEGVGDIEITAPDFAYFIHEANDASPTGIPLG